MLVTELNNRNVFKHSHSISFSKHSLSSLALDIFYTIISQVKNEDESLNEYFISIRDLEKRIMGKDKSGKRINRENISRAADELMSQKIKIINDTEEIQFPWFNRAVVNKKEHFISLKMNEDLREHLIDLGKYVKGDLKSFLSLRSKYSKRIYTIACQYVKMKKITIKLSDLHESLELDQSFIKRYSNFKTRVLEQAKKEINSLTDIEMSYKEIKTGRSITEIEFLFLKKDTKESKCKVTKSKQISTKKVEEKKGVTSLDSWLNSSKEEEILDIELIK